MSVFAPNLHFNPLLEGNGHLTLSSDLDPDSNIYSNLYDCGYYTEDQFNEILKKKCKMTQVCLF